MKKDKEIWRLVFTELADLQEQLDMNTEEFEVFLHNIMQQENPHKVLEIIMETREKHERRCSNLGARNKSIHHIRKLVQCGIHCIPNIYIGINGSLYS